MRAQNQHSSLSVFWWRRAFLPLCARCEHSSSPDMWRECYGFRVGSERQGCSSAGMIQMSVRRVRAFILLLAAAVVLAGCSGNGNSVHFGGTETNNVPVTTSMSSVGETPPPGVSVLSLQVTITDARLNPGNVELLAAPVTIDLARLQTETSLLSAVNVAPGTYTSLALTIAPNPLLSLQNNTGAALTVGGAQCANGAICEAGLVTASDSQSVSFPGAGITLAPSTPAALLIDVNLSDLLSGAANTISVNLGANGALAASQIVPQQGAPFEALEDVVGVISGPANGAFVVQTALGNYNITTNSSTKYLNFPAGVCTSQVFACIAANEIVSVNMSLQANNTLIATDIFFEDSSTTLPEIEGVVVATGGLPAQFSMVVLQETPAASGPAIGGEVEVTINNGTTFAIDNLAGTLNTSPFSFAVPADVIVGQEVAVQRGAGSSGSVIQAGRVLLRSSRITGTVLATPLPNITAGGLPPFLQNASPAIAQIKVETASEFTPNGTEFGGTAASDTQIIVGRSISVRGQLFANSGNPALLATRVVQNN
jgi:hypothetical protein